MGVKRTFRRAWHVADVGLSRLLMRPPGVMPFLLCQVTYRCNLRCQMCDCWRTPADHSRGELTTDEWRRVIDQGVELKTWGASFTGGEPLLRKDIEDLVRHSRGHGLSTHLCTNGVLLTAGRAESLTEAGLGSMNVSLDSADAPTHNAMRGRPVFETVVDNVRRLHRIAPNVHIGISCTIARRNYHNLTRMVRFAESLGAQSLRFAPIHTNLLHHRMDKASFGDLPLRIEDLPAVDSAMRQVMREFERSTVHRNSRIFLRGIGRIARTQRVRGCVAGFATACVDPYGRMAPCPDIEGVANIRDTPLAETWQSPAFQRLRRRVANCHRPCWDTSYAELSLRFNMKSTLADPKQFLGELKFYLE